MEKSIVIPVGQIGNLIEYYNELLNSVNDRIAPLLKERNEIEALLSQLKGTPGYADIAIAEIKKYPAERVSGKRHYSANLSIPKKIRFVLEAKKEPLTTSEILNEIKIIEPNTDVSIPNISSELSRAISNGIKYYRVGENRLEYKYGLLEWKTTKVMKDHDPYNTL